MHLLPFPQMRTMLARTCAMGLGGVAYDRQAGVGHPQSMHKAWEMVKMTAHRL
jgi:hypothetical protein